jgi:hypothetical protein
MKLHNTNKAVAWEKSDTNKLGFFKKATTVTQQLIIPFITVIEQGRMTIPSR